MEQNNFINTENKQTMTKQQILDSTPTNTQEAVTQELLRTLNKTNLASVRRSVKLLHYTLYKSQWRETSLTNLMSALDIVEAITTNEQQ